MPLQVWIDTDNALGSDRGDVDDAYAIAALIKSGAPVTAISSVAGNVEELHAHENNRRLCALLGWSGPLLRASEARDNLTTFRGRVVAIGPLTNVTRANAASEIILVGGNSVSRGRWPPLWPHEFNLTFDRDATRRVFASDVPLTIFPLNVARALGVSRPDLNAIGGRLGEHMRAHSERWFRYLRLARFTTRFSIYDLAAAMYLIDPGGYEMERMKATMRANTFLEFGCGTRQVTLCRGLNRERLWQRFLALVNR